MIRRIYWPNDLSFLKMCALGITTNTQIKIQSEQKLRDRILSFTSGRSTVQARWQGTALKEREDISFLLVVIWLSKENMNNSEFTDCLRDNAFGGNNFEQSLLPRVSRSTTCVLFNYWKSHDHSIKPVSFENRVSFSGGKNKFYLRFWKPFWKLFSKLVKLWHARSKLIWPQPL